MYALELIRDWSADDNTCRIWAVETGEAAHLYRFKSAAVSVRSHASKPTQLLVACADGGIHLIDTRTECAVLSVSSRPCLPLGEVRWSQRHVRVKAFSLADLALDLALRLTGTHWTAH